MINKVIVMPLFVMDQDAALDFYVNKFGFQVHTDATMPDGYRWLTIKAPGQSDFELVLITATTEEQRDLVGNQAADAPLMYVSTDDCDATFQELRRQSVEVVQEPEDQPWGRDCLMADLYGNVIGVCQPK